MKVNWVKIFVLLAFTALIGCTTSGDSAIDFGGNRTKNSQIYTINSTGGVYKIGNPYKIFGTWYYPREDYSYSETGMSSWYGDGDGFHAKSTANGEKYNMNALTAAHRTLPLPSIVKVTNLENGRSVILRVNDRGPYAKSRIIDVSKKAAEILGFRTKGTAKVRVEILPEESKKLKEAMLRKSGGDSWVKANKKTPAAAVKTAAKAATVKTGPKYVQAGSFSNYDSAQNLKAQLGKFDKAYVVPTTVDGTKFYRVRLGPYKYDAEAEVVLNKVRDYGIYNAKIIHD